MDLEKKIKNARINIIVLVVLYSIGLVSNLGGLFNGTVSIWECLPNLFCLALLVMALKSYKENPLKAANLEKIVGIFLIASLVLSVVMAIVLVYALDSSVYYSFFEIVIKSLLTIPVIIQLIISLFLLHDGIKIPRLIEEENGETYDEINLMPIFVAIIILIINLITSISAINDTKKQMEELNELFSGLSSSNITSSYDAEYDFTTKQEELEETQKKYDEASKKEQAELEDFLSYINSVTGNYVYENDYKDTTAEISDNETNKIIISNSDKEETKGFAIPKSVLIISVAVIIGLLIALSSIKTGKKE